MKRPDPTRKQIERFVTASKFQYRMEFVLDFDRPISVAKGREAARRILDALQATCSFDAPDGLADVSLKSWELRRVVKIKVEDQQDG